MSFVRCCRAILSFSLFVLALPSVVAVAQDSINPSNTGLPRNGVFHGTDVENVQLNNGNLHVDIPVWSVKGRGLDADVHFIYDNKGWTYTTNCHATKGNPVCTDTVKQRSQIQWS